VTHDRLTRELVLNPVSALREVPPWPGLLPPPSRAPLALHRRLPGYAVTPLREVPALAGACGVGRVWVKDESTRLGLPAFKMLGASWATYRTVAARLGGLERLDQPAPWANLAKLRERLRPLGHLTLTAATDGNHGRAVARMAALLGFDAEIYVPIGTAAARITAIASEGARVTVVDGTYDDAVATATASADEHRLLIQDTAQSPDDQIAAWVAEGYATIFWETDEQLAEQLAATVPDMVMIPVGVGALAAAAVRHWWRRELDPARRPRLVGVEPLRAACVLRSIEAGRLVTVAGPHDSIMAGLNCGTPSPVAWPVLREGLAAVVAVGDERARQAMRDLAAAGIVAGETGAAALAGLAELTDATGAGVGEEARRALGVGPDSRVLLLCTEGATDPDAYRRIVASSADPDPEIKTERRS